MPFTQPWFEVDFGSNYAGIGTTGYRLYQANGTDSVARTTTGVVDLSNGAYGVPSVNVPDNAVGIEWDTGGGSPVYAREDVEPYRDRDAQFDPASDEVDIGAVKGTGVTDVDDFKADVSALAIEANVETHVGNALSTYTAPTKAELDAAETNIISEIDANESKIDAIITTLGLLNDLSIADVQTALTNQGYTSGRALLLDNLDAAITSLNNLSIADIQTALTNQGYTSGRSLLLDNLDATISSIATAIGLLNNLSQADVQAAMTSQGYTIVRAGLLDNLDAAISTVITAIALLAVSTEEVHKVSVLHEGMARAGTINSIQLAADASVDGGAYDPGQVVIIEGVGQGQTRNIMQYSGTSKICTLDRNWKVIPTTASRYAVRPNAGRQHVNEGLAQGGTINSITLNALGSTDDGAYDSQIVYLRSGTGEDQSGVVESYDGTTKIAIMRHDWSVIPDNTTGYCIIPFHTHEPDEHADAVWAHADGVALLADMEFVKHIEGGRWLIDEAVNQMVFYEDDNITEVARFDLFDISGVAAYESVFERRRV